MARSLCVCSARLLELNKQAESASDSLAFRDIADEFEKTRACILALGIKPEDRPALEIALTAHCPAIAAHRDILPELLGQ